MNKKKTILVADDIQMNRALFTQILQDEYDVVTACDGKEALAVLRQAPSRFSLALIDLKMPVMDGFELLSVMRTEESLRDIPVIIITASNEEESEIRALDKGANDYLTKPIQPRIVRRRISAAIDRMEMEKLKSEKLLLERQVEHRQELELILENIDCGVSFIELRGERVILSYANAWLCAYAGRTQEEYLREAARDIYYHIHPEDVFRLRALFTVNLPMGRGIEHSVRFRTKDGSYRWIQLCAKHSGSEKGREQFIFTYMDIDEEVKSRETLRLRAEHDELTGIYNKGTFIKKTEEYLRADPAKSRVLIRINIERFKIINEIFGVQTGDELLCRLADKLRATVESKGVFGRIEADHFAVCIPAELLDLEQMVQAAVSSKMCCNTEYQLVLNFGIYEIDDPFLPVEKMCDRAKLALDTIRGQYHVHYAFYDDLLRQNMLREQEIRAEMDGALKRREFAVYLQPVISLTSGAPVSAEALVRWIHPQKGVISPGEFIPLFESTDFICALDHYIWHEVCHLLQERRQNGLSAMPISVNVSRRSMFDPNLADDIFALAKEHGVSPSLLRVEITERAYTSNLEQLLKNTEKLREHGFPVLMDDFGSGHSSLNTLKDIPVDMLKIDMKFLEGFEKGGRVGTILTSVMRMAKWMGTAVIAEGVETAEQVDFLRSVGCDYVQGYYYARPMPAEDFESFIKGNFRTAAEEKSVRCIDECEIDMLMGGSQLINRLLGSVFGGIAFYEYKDTELDVLRVNTAYYEITGMTPTLLSSKNMDVFQLIGDEERNICTQAIEKAIAEKKEQRFTLRRRRGDTGAELFLDCVTRHISGDGEHAVICIAFADITAQKQAELAIEARRESEEHRSRILNENAERLLLEQYDVTRAVNESLHSLIDYFEADRAYIFEFDWEKGEVSNTFEQCRSGIEAQIENLQHLPIETVDIWMDAFREKEGLFIANVAELSDDDIAKYLLQSQGITNLISVPLYYQKRMLGFIGVDDPRANLTDAKILSTIGIYILNELAKRLRLLEEQKQKRLLDASLAKEQETRDRYRLIVEHAGLAVFEWNMETGEFYTSPSYEKYALSNIESERLFKNEGALDIIHPDDREKLLAFFKECGRHIPFAETELRMLMKDGSFRYTRMCAIMLYDQLGGALLRTIGTLQDIEEEVAAKAALERANEQLRGVLDKLPCGIGIFDIEGERVLVNYINDGYFEMYGETREERGHLFGEEPLQAVYAQDRPAIFEAIQKYERDGGAGAADVDFRVLVKGQYRYVNAKGVSVGKSGQVTRYHFVFSDENDKHRAMLALRESRTALAAAVEISGIRLWKYDMKTNSISFDPTLSKNKQWREGIKVDGGLWNEKNGTGILPEYHKDYLALLERLKNGEESAQMELRFSDNADQEPLWLRLQYTLLSKEHGDALGIATNISEQKRIEQRNQDENAYHEALIGTVDASLRLNVSQGSLESVHIRSSLTGSIDDVEHYHKWMKDGILHNDEYRKLYLDFSTENLLMAFKRGDLHRTSEYCIQKTDGSSAWWQVTTDLLKNGEGQIMAFISGRDISSEKRTELMVQTAVARDFDFIGYIDIMADAYYFIRDESSKTYLPPTKGTDIAAMAEECIFSHTGKEAREQLSAESVFNALERDSCYDVYHTIIQQDDSLARKQKRISYIDKERKILLVTQKDVTEQFRHEQQEQCILSAALRDAKLASAAKSDFLARMSHDLRTPMDAIIGIAALAQGQTQDASAMEEALGQISRVCGFLLSIVSDILDISDIERDEFILHPKAYGYLDFIEVIQTMISPLCKAKNIEFTFEGESAGMPLYIDQTRIEQVFFNLLSNAVKFTPEGGKVSFAYSHGEAKDGKLPCEFVVSDNGIGMSEDFQEHMFEMFARESHEVTSEYAGAGLGLPIALRIVNAMGGDIQIQSERGKGTKAKVRIELPLAEESRIEQTIAPSEQEIAKRLWSSRVMLVEDNATNARLLSALLRQRGVNVEIAENGQEALNLFMAEKPFYFDAVLMDIRMPLMDGWEATELLRTMPREDAKSIPIIAVSANAFASDVKKSYEAGMQAHLSKPIDPAKLYQTLAKFMKKRSNEDGERET